MTVYCVSLGLPRAMIWFVAGLLRDKRREVGTRKGTRVLTCFRQAVLRRLGDLVREGARFRGVFDECVT